MSIYRMEHDASDTAAEAIVAAVLFVIFISIVGSYFSKPDAPYSGPCGSYGCDSLLYDDDGGR